MRYRSYLQVDKEALAHNLKQIKMFSGKSAVMAMVKANAYGGGLQEMVTLLEREGVEHFGTVYEAEALQLRRLTKGRVYLLGVVVEKCIPDLVREDVTFGLSLSESIEKVAKESQRQGKKTRVHLEVETGMGRFGTLFENYKQQVSYIESFPSLDLEGIYTHFAMGGTEDPRTHRQRECLASIRKDYPHKIVHGANSETVFLGREDLNLDMVRPGVALYGYLGDQDKAKKFLKGAFILKSQLLAVRRLLKGMSVGYDFAYTLPADANIGTLAIGHSGGYPTPLGNKAYVSLRGKRYPVVGGVCMDFIMINLGDDEYPVGEEAEILGGNATSFYEVAEITGAELYAVLTALSLTTKRVYV